MGKANTRKSSLVRCLIGTDNPATEIEILQESGLQIHVRGLIGAAQEKGILPSVWVTEMESTAHWRGGFPSVRNIIATLRYDAETTGGTVFPPGEDYVDALINAGWSVRAIVSLGEPARNWIRQSGLPYLSILKSQSMPSNAIAATVRKALGWA
jgi:hypothetical protein